MSADHKRPSPEEPLRRGEAEERYERRGRLKVFLGYASGVGKSRRMLDEGRRQRGQDVVVGAVQASRVEAGWRGWWPIWSQFRFSQQAP